MATVPTQLQACSGCGTALAPANVLYSADARIVCARCYAQADIVETDKRHANTIRNAGLACAAGGLVTFFSPLSGLLFVVLAAAAFTISTGIYAILQVAGGKDRFTQHLSQGDVLLVWICSIFGIGVAALVGLGTLAGIGLLLSV
jgi:hypothetical protein